MGGKSHDRRSSTANQRNSSGHPHLAYSTTKIARGRRCENAAAFGNEQELNKSRQTFILNLNSCFSGFHNKTCYAITAKTKVMVVDNTPININNVLIENVQGYVYLGQHYSLKEKNQDKEIQRRIMAGWAAYAKHRDIFKSNLAICLKRQVYNSCVLPAMTYGAETWTLTKQAQNKLAAAQTKMERSMLNITYKDRKTNIWVRERTKVIDIINTVRKMKWSWAGHINRLKDDRWTSRVTSWRPYDKKRRQGRPAKRWRDDLDKYWSDTIWQRKAQDRVVWRQHAEAFAQPRDTTAA